MPLKLLPLTAAATCALAASAGAADAAPRKLSVPSAVRVVEGAEVRVAVKLPKAARTRTSVRWSIAAGGDLVRTSGVVRIARGKRAGSVRLVTRQDALREGDERFTLKVGRRSVRVTIADDDGAPVTGTSGSGTGTPAPPPPQPRPTAPEPPVLPVAPPLPVVSVGDLSRGEGPADVSQPALALSRPSTEDVVVSWAYSDGTAKEGHDFVAMDGTTTIKAGKKSASLPIQVVSDAIDEDHSEAFEVTLVTAQGATIGRGSGVITIVDDDPKPALLVQDGEPRLENATTMPFAVTLDRPSIHEVTAKFYTANGSGNGGAACAAGKDFISTTGTLTFAPGETTKSVGVTICEDAVAEGDETVKLRVHEVSEWAALGDHEGIGIIQQDAD